MDSGENNKLEKVVLGLISIPDSASKKIDYILEKRKEAANGRLWVFPGGRLMENEELTDALIREAYEELSIEIGIENYVGSRIMKNLEIFYFKAYHVSGVPVPDKEEIIQVGLFSPADTMKILDGRRVYSPIWKIIKDSAKENNLSRSTIIDRISKKELYQIKGK